MLRRRIWLLLAVVCALPETSHAQVMGSNAVFGRYLQSTWQEQDGLPQTTVIAVATTRDGYVWVGTYEGVARFDGVRFTLFNPTNTSAIGNSMVDALLEDRSGALWLGTYGGGLTRFAAGRFTQLTTHDGLPNDFVNCLYEDRDGALWIGTDGGGAARLKDGRVTVFRMSEGVTANRVRGIAQDARGAIWLATARGLARIDDGRVTTTAVPEGLKTIDARSLFIARDGAIWSGAFGGGLFRVRDGELATFGVDDGLPAATFESFHEDRDGRLWAGTVNAGLVRFDGQRFERYSTGEGLPGGRVAAITTGVANDLWLGTEGGLVRLSDPAFRTLTTANGLSTDRVGDIAEDAAGDVWVASRTGLNQFHDGRFITYTTRDGLPDDRVIRLARTRDGAIWALTGGGLVQRDGDRFVTTPLDPTLTGVVATMARAADGTMWFGLDGGVVLVRNGTIVGRYSSRNGLTDDAVLSLYEDRGGAMWVGTLHGGVTRIAKGQLTTWSTRDGLANNHVKAFYEAPDGAMWIGTHGGGLSRLKDGRLSTVSSRQGLFNDIVFTILDDADGNLWMNCNRGVWRTSLRELNDVADGRRAMVTSFPYGVTDGMLASEGIGAQLAGGKMRDGSLWFATVRGAVVVHPARRGTQPPRVVIEGATIDRQPTAVDQPLRLSASQENLEIDYAGLSWSRPREVRFRYRLEGLDRDWVEAGTRRTAYFSHLPPGSYTFVVTADNGEGVWSADGQRLGLTILPPFYRTWWFQSVALLVVAAAIAGAWRLRVAQLTRASEMQQAFARDLIGSQERERQRIAAELHDSLGQRLVVIRNLAVMSLQAESGSSGTQRVEAIADQTVGAIGEIRDIAYNLRPYHLDTLGLTKALEVLVRTTASASSLAIADEIDDVDNLVPPDQAINLYRIVQESLHNIVKHAKATTASVTVTVSGAVVRLTIQDDGVGFAGDGPRRAQRGGFGLVGISERATLLAGKATIRSVPGAGTTVEVEVPVSPRPDLKAPR